MKTLGSRFSRVFAVAIFLLSLSSTGTSTRVNAALPLLASYPYSTDLLPTNVDSSINIVSTFTGLNSYVGNDGFGNVYEVYPETGTVSAATVNSAKYVQYSLTKLSGNFEQISVSFEVGKGGNSDPRGFLVKTSLDDYTNPVMLETLPSGNKATPVAKTFTVDASQKNSISFRFFVWAPTVGNSIDFRNLSFGSVALPMPGAPLAPTVVAGSSSAVVTVAAGTGGTPASYLVTSTPGSFTCTVTGASGNCTVSGLTNGTSYTFQATATNGGGTSALSTASTAITPIAPTTTTSSTTTIPSTTTTTTAAPVLSIVIQAPVTTVAQGQASVATIAPVTTTIPVRGANGLPVSITTTTVSSTQTKTIATTTTTTPAIVTTTTVGPPEVAKVSTGQTAVQIDGVKTDATVTRENNQMVVTAGSLSATLSGIDKAGKTSPLDSDGNIHLAAGDVIKISVGGFDPGSLVEVWLFSTPMKLGSIVVGDDGTVTGAYRLPFGIKSGSHRVVVTAKLVNGKSTTFTLGILVGTISQTSTLTRVLIGIPISLAIGFGFLLPTQLRRRRRGKLSHA